MPVWAWIAISAGALMLLAATAAVAILAFRAYERRALLKLLVRTEGVEAAAAALNETVGRLALAEDDELETFAGDPESMERRTLAEVASRSGILADELDRMPMPRKLVPAAEAIADAAILVGEQANVVNDADIGVAALEGLASLDLSTMRAYLRKARILLTDACDRCGLEETAVYGGGLYL